MKPSIGILRVTNLVRQSCASGRKRASHTAVATERALFPLREK